MKKKTLLLLTLALTACGGGSGESASSVAATTPAQLPTVAPSPAGVVPALPVVTPTPPATTATPSPTPAPVVVTTVPSPAPAVTPPPVITPLPVVLNMAEGLWSGRSDKGHFLRGLVLNDGRYWIIYSPVNSTEFKSIDGVILGGGSGGNGSFASLNAKDFNFSGLGVNNGTINANYQSGKVFNGSINYSFGTKVGFTSSYDANYEQTPDLAALAGIYESSFVWMGESAAIVIDTKGKLTGYDSKGCQLSGSLKAANKGNAFELNVSYAASTCPYANSTVTGIAYFDAVSQQLFAAALNSSQSHGFVFSAPKK